jgi:hypothetical protein
METSLDLEHSYLSFCLFVFSSILLIREEIILFGLGGFLQVREGFSIAATVAKCF